MRESRDPSYIEFQLDNEITVVFRKVIKTGEINIEKSESVELLKELEARPLDGAVQYFRIDTTIVTEGIIKIRILVRARDKETKGQILEWRNGKWCDRTLYCVNVGIYKLIVGVTDHLSGFGIR